MRRYSQTLVGVALALALVGSYWPTCRDLWDFLLRNEDYSAGLLVPLVAAYVIWSDRKTLAATPISPCWWGVLVLVAAQAIRFAGLLFYYGSLERYSMVLTVLGAVLTAFGRAVAWRLKWVMLFLVLAMPLPGRIDRDVSLRLQSVATSSASFGLDLIGCLVVREGNTLKLSDGTPIEVAGACNGLRMLTAFVVVGTTLAFVMCIPAWLKAVVVLSTAPVAILTNSIRLIVTVMLYELAGPAVGERFVHDFAGLTMMPFALGFLLLEIWLLRRLGGGQAGSASKIGMAAQLGGRTSRA